MQSLLEDTKQIFLSRNTIFKLTIRKSLITVFANVRKLANSSNELQRSSKAQALLDLFVPSQKG